MGLSLKEKKAVTRQIRSRYQKANRKEKAAILNEVQFITGYNRKYAPRILNQPQTPHALPVVKDKAVKLPARKKRPVNRKGKKIYTDEVIASWPAFAITPAIREKLLSISPRTRFRGGDHRPCPQKRQGHPRPQGQKSHPHRHRCRLRLDMPVFPP